MEAKGFAVRETVVATGYNVSEEVQKTLWADVIVTQTPAFWLGTPWIHKKYIDDVFTAAMLDGTFLSGDGRPEGQYGSGGKLKGKKHLLSITMNAPREAFGDPGQKLFAGRTVDEAYATASAAYRFCGAEILPVFACCDVIKKPDVQNDFMRLTAYLKHHFG